MAATFASSSAVTGLGSSSLSSPSRASSPKKICLSSGFVKSPVAARSPLRLAGTHGGKFMCFERDWLRKDLNVIGWLAPSSIPAIGGKSLSGLFFLYSLMWVSGPACAHLD
ncbi:hypothetical protein BDE02_09G142800 [Populus trichocarpa]|nr:hypothetical protein BDE02_09G142800 [Populus trichocarpa]